MSWAGSRGPHAGSLTSTRTALFLEPMLPRMEINFRSRYSTITSTKSTSDFWKRMMNTSITLPQRYLRKDAGKYRESSCPMEFCIRCTTRMQLGCSRSQLVEACQDEYAH